MISSRTGARDSLLFVYGTLRPFADIPMARWLQRVAHYVGPATTRGRLYDRGSYPCLRIDGCRRERVVGDVYRVAARRVLRVLDRYETRFVRERCIVELVGGARRRAWAYRYLCSVVGLPLIAGGDYRAYRQHGRRRPSVGSTVA
jgi:gamma-glutamylcyclotransferase (GGCT)/AIG2-like uncharacterized protein YtfP